LYLLQKHIKMHGPMKVELSITSTVRIQTRHVSQFSRATCYNSAAPRVNSAASRVTIQPRHVSQFSRVKCHNSAAPGVTIQPRHVSQFRSATCHNSAASRVTIQPRHVSQFSRATCHNFIVCSDHRSCNVLQRQKIEVWPHAVHKKKRRIILLVW